MTNRFQALLLTSAIILAGCSPMGSLDEFSHFQVNPANFVDTIDNPYFPHIPGAKYVYEGQTEDGVERTILDVLDRKKLVAGIKTTVMRDRVYQEGQIVEDTFDYFAQDKSGNVWYFGEDVKNYEDGALVDTDGSWLAGVGGAVPGIVMYATPAAHIGETYNQEMLRGIAEDKGKVLASGLSLSVPFGTFHNVVKTFNFTPLDAESKEYKYFAAGVGEIKTVDLLTGEEAELVTYTTR